MSDETLRLLTSSDALDGLLVGLVGLMLLGAWAAVRNRPVSGGGLLVVVAAALALEWTHRIPVELIVGVALLAIAGLVRPGSTVASIALAIPGAAAIGAAFVSSPRAGLVVFVVVGVAVVAPIVAAYDAQDHEAATGVALLVVSMCGVFLTVPDTDLVVVLAAASIPFVVAGPPLRLARLGRSGAQAGSGILIWAVAVGGESRVSALIAGTAALGLLVVVPLLRAIGTRTVVTGLSSVAIQAGLCILLALVAGLGPWMVAAFSAILLALVAVAVAPPLWRFR